MTSPFTILITFGIIIIAFVAFNGALGVAVLETSNVSHVTDVLMGLFLAALFMERAQEVFITAWRAGGRQKLERAIEDIKAAVAADSNDRTATQHLVSSQDELDNYKSETQKHAYFFGLAIGLLIALAGVRSLSHIANHENLQGFQQSLFYGLDIGLTAALIAGGSDALHKLISVFTDAMDATRKRIKAAEPAS